MSSERRRRYRAVIERPVSWRPRDRAGEAWRPGHLLDISSGGARVRSPAAPVHHDLVLVVALEEHTPGMRVDAELVRIEAQLESGEFSWAVAFVGLGSEVQAHLGRFVFRQAARATAA